MSVESPPPLPEEIKNEREFCKRKLTGFLSDLQLPPNFIDNVDICAFNSVLTKKIEITNTEEFIKAYKVRFLELMQNLHPDKGTKNDYLFSKICSGEITFPILEKLQGVQLHPIRHQKIVHQIEQRFNKNKEKPTSLYKCRRCKTNYTSFIEKQTRSADEPMTVFVRCHNCGNNWRD